MANRKLLIVDDEVSMSELLKEHFQDQGFQVSTAVSGQEAIDILKEEKPKVVLLDIRLKGKMDGIAVLKEARDISADSKIIMISALDDEYRQEAKNLGAYAFLGKPIQIDSLDELVEEIIK